MKKVGILTIHAVANFGSLFQAYALQETIRKMGYKVDIINYLYPNEYHKTEYNRKSPYANTNVSIFEKLKGRLYTLFGFSKHYSERRKRKYIRAQKSLLNLSILYPTKDSLAACNGKYDIYVTGSDQVWNPRYMFDDTSFLLPFSNSPNKLAFSASFGTTELDAPHRKIYEPLLKQYRFLSVREPSGVEIIKDTCGKEACYTCDPTLLLTKEDWIGLDGRKPLVKGKYILCYVLTYTSNPYPYAYKLISYVKQQLGYKVVCIDDTCRYWIKPPYIFKGGCGPMDIINLFANASFIISSSFHGTAFSLYFEKDFYSILPPNVKDDRQESLLKKIGAENRIVRVGDAIDKLSMLHINNWHQINAKLSLFRNESILFLSDSLKRCNND